MRQEKRSRRGIREQAPTDQGRGRDEQGRRSVRGDPGAMVLLIPVQRHLGSRQTVQGQVLGLCAIEDRALDRRSTEGQLQMPAQTAGGDAGVIGQPAEIRALTQGAEPAMRTDQRADQFRVRLSGGIADHHLCPDTTPAERNGKGQVQDVGTEIVRLQPAERRDSAGGQAKGEAVGRDPALGD